MSSFKFAIPGQPPTLNKMHKTVWRTNSRGERYKGRAKEEGVAEYQMEATSECRKAKPADWAAPPFSPKSGQGNIVIRYWFYLQRPVDVDNAIKILNDAIKVALGVDDDRFLPQAWWRQTGFGKKARVEVEIET